MTADATRWGSDEPVNEIGTASEPQPTPFARSAVESCYGECALRPLEGRPYSGWFARGALHLIAGSSGAGKSTLVLDLLQAQARGARYLGHGGGNSTT